MSLNESSVEDGARRAGGGAGIAMAALLMRHLWRNKLTLHLLCAIFGAYEN